MKILIGIGLSLLLNGCVSAEYAPSKLKSIYPPRVAPEAIELFRTTEPVKKYIEIGAVSSCCSGDQNRMIERLRKKAAEAGGDALIAVEFNAAGIATGTVIRYDP